MQNQVFKPAQSIKLIERILIMDSHLTKIAYDLDSDEIIAQTCQITEFVIENITGVTYEGNPSLYDALQDKYFDAVIRVATGKSSIVSETAYFCYQLTSLCRSDSESNHNKQ